MRHSVIILALFISCSSALATTTYHIGNSLTWDLLNGGRLLTGASAAGLTMDSGYHICCGRPLNYMLNNPESVCVDPTSYGMYTEALPGYAWDAVTLQPHSGASPQEEYLAAKNLILSSVDTDRFYLYATWPQDVVDYSAQWYDTSPIEPDAPLVRNALTFEWIYEQLVNDPELADKSIYMIPAGYVLAEIDQRMKSGEIPGYSGAQDLYRDPIHLNNLGRYAVGHTLLSVLSKQNPVSFPVIVGYEQRLDVVTDLELTDTYEQAVRSVVWEVVSTFPSSGLIEGDLDGDGYVGLADLDIVLANWNADVTTGSLLTGDPSGDGFVGLDDLDAVLTNWNAGTPPAQLIPAPASAVMSGLLVLLYGVYRP